MSIFNVMKFDQCCDSDHYAKLGDRCLNNIASCYDNLRPVGAIILNALMPHGLASFNHTLLLFFSLLFIASESGSILNRNCSMVLMIKVSGVFILLELMFAGLVSVNLTDASSGIFAGLAILGFCRKNVLLFVFAGGISVLIRAAYLYPMLILVIWFLIESLYVKSHRNFLLTSLFFVCITPQFLLTYQHTGVFAFLDPTTVAYWRDIHLSSNYYGYDTIFLPPSINLPFEKATSMPWQSSLLDLPTAYKQKQWSDIVHLLAGRIEFYFSSFVPWSKAYLNSPSERIFSPLVMVLNITVFVISSIYLKQKDILWRVWFPLSLILAQSLLIVPEQRFIFVIQLFLIIFTYLKLWDSYENTENLKCQILNK
ncbi:MAG: hypothetical protein NTW85_11965 [Methylococcales bacterium]|nr:hypothetical protein [Methylococcales bacterium]